MGQLIKYEKLFQIGLQHGYYDQGHVTNGKWMSLVPTEQTMLLIKNGRMKFVSTKYNAILFYQADANGAPLINLDTETFGFAIYPENKTEFIDNTKLTIGSESFSAKKVFLSTNISNTAPTDSSLPEMLNLAFMRSPQNKLFNYEFELISPPSTGELSIIGSSIKIENLNLINGTNVQQLDMRNEANNKYAIIVKNGTDIINEEDVYIDRNLSALGTIGFLEISPVLMNQTTFYTFKFDKKP